MLIRDRAKLVAMLLIDLTDRVQPVVDEPPALSVNCRAHPATAVVTNDHDVVNLHHIDRELQHREIVGVLRRRKIGDIAVYEELARGLGRQSDWRVHGCQNTQSIDMTASVGARAC